MRRNASLRIESAEKNRAKILEGTIRVYRSKGLRLTMDDIAAELGMSKKSIYAAYRSKDELFISMVDMIFDGIQESKRVIVEDEGLSTMEKIHRVLGAMPDSYNDIEFSGLYDLRGRFPQVYERLEYRLETDWVQTLALMARGIEEGVIRPVSLPVVKVMLESTLEKFFQSETLIRSGLSYSDALKEVVEVIVKGIETR